MESLEVKKYYRWVYGQRTGRVETYLAESDDSIYFESGRFISKDSFSTQLMEIEEAEYKSKVNEQDLPPPPPPVPQSIEEWEATLGGQSIIQENIQSVQVQNEPVKEKSPIKIILEKQKKLSKLNLNFVLEDLEFPSPKVIEFMSMMFDDDEIVDELTEFVYSQMTQEEIHQCIKNSIKNHIIETSGISGE